MRKELCTASLFLCILTWPGSPARAGFTLPPEVYRMEQFGDAQNQAKAANSPLLFLYSNEHTD